MAFYQKYRSKTFSELIGQEHIVVTLLEAIKSNRLVHAYLLTGPRGIGKTSTARLLAKAMNCQKIIKDQAAGHRSLGEPCNQCESCVEINEGRAIDIMEIDAASHTGVNDVRELIDQARLLPAKTKRKVYIIDEVHMLSKSAFNALLKTLEEPPNHVVFIMATTEVHKIPATILSRAQRFDFKKATKSDLLKNLRNVAKSEGIDVDSEALDLIAAGAAGGHRDALSLLEKVSSARGKITLEKARKILGVAEEKEVFEFVRAIFNSSTEEGLKIAHKLSDAGYDMAEFNRSVIELLRRVLIIKISGSGDLLIDETKEHLLELKKIAVNNDAERIILLMNLFLEAGALLKDVAYPVLPIEIAVAKANDQKIEESRMGNVEPENDKIKKKIETPTKADEELKNNVSDTDPNDEKPDSNATMKQSNNSAPIPILEMTKDIWASIISETKKINNSLAALLRDAKPSSMTDDVLTLEVKFKFHKDRISDPKNCQILEKIVSETTGRKCRIVCKAVEKPAVVDKPALQNDRLEQAVTEVFEV